MTIQRKFEAASVSDEVYNILEKEILNLVLKPGQIITEQDIVDRYQISRTPSRDVLKRLKTSGLVTSVPYKGNYVSYLDFDTIKQFIFMRQVLETRIIKDAIKETTPSFIDALDRNLSAQDSLLKNDFEADEFYEIDGAFHKLWYLQTNKEKIWEEVQKIQVHYTRFRMLDIVAVKNFQAIYEDHKNLADIIKNKEVDKVEDFVQEHLNSGIKRLGDKIYTEYAEYFIPGEFT